MTITTFAQPVDKRSRGAMVDFLAGHFRYSTMNTWNRLESYANNVKLHNLGIDGDLWFKAFDVIETSEAQDRFGEIISAWTAEQGYRYTAGFNGRSSGYLVLYRSSRIPSPYKSWCGNCGQGNCNEATDESKRCGRCGEDRRYNATRYELRVESRGIDESDPADYEDWSMDQLRAETTLVQDFDRLCDDMVAALVEMCEDYEVIEETRYSPYTVKVLV